MPDATAFADVKKENRLRYLPVKCVVVMGDGLLGKIGEQTLPGRSGRQ